MSDRLFDRETLLDLLVNVIPLFILLFFVVLYVLIAPFPADPLVLVIQLSIILLTAGGLLILTYFSGKAISSAEKDIEEYIPAGYSREDAKVAGVPGEDRDDEESEG